MAQVGAEHLDGLVVGLLLAQCGKLILYRRTDEAAVAVGHGVGDERLAGTRAVDIVTLEAADALLVVNGDGDAQEALGLTTAQRQQPVRRTAAQFLAEGEVVGIFLCIVVIFLLRHDARRDDGLTAEGLAHGLARSLIHAHILGDDVLRPFQSGCGIGDVVFDITLCGSLGMRLTLQYDERSQRLEPLLAGYLGAGAATRLVGHVDVLQFGGIPALRNAVAQRVGELTLCVDGLENGILALLQLLEFLVEVADGRHLHFVEVAGGLLAVAADERYGAAGVEQVERGVDLLQAYGRLVGNDFS